MITLSNIPFTIDKNKVISRLQIPENDRELYKKIDNTIISTQKVTSPKALYKICYVESKELNSVLIDNIEFKSKILRKNLARAERVFPFVASCGREIDNIMFNDDDLITPYILDVIKETALSCAFDYLKNHIRKKYRISNLSSMSPGSLKDWPIEQQRELFSLLGNVEEQIGVKLTGSMLMNPVKSVSGIFFPSEIDFESCRLCPRENCPKRRKKYDPQLAKEYEQ